MCTDHPRPRRAEIRTILRKKRPPRTGARAIFPKNRAILHENRPRPGRKRSPHVKHRAAEATTRSPQVKRRPLHGKMPPPRATHRPWRATPRPTLPSARPSRIPHGRSPRRIPRSTAGIPRLAPRIRPFWGGLWWCAHWSSILARRLGEPERWDGGASRHRRGWRKCGGALVREAWLNIHLVPKRGSLKQNAVLRSARMSEGNGWI